VQCIHIIAQATFWTGEQASAKHQTLEIICRKGGGHPETRLHLQRCRLLDRGREKWSATLEADDNQWVLHNELGDDEPIWFLRVHCLRPGEYVSLQGPAGETIEFRIQQMSGPLT
jgi:hypothetical protein